MVTLGLAILTGVIGDAIWDGLKHLVPAHAVISMPHVNLPAIFQLFFFILVALVGVFIGRHLEKIRNVVPIDTLLRSDVRQSRTFVLEVEGTQLLDIENSDWRFFLTNCTSRVLRHVELYNIKSDLGTYLLGFHEIPVIKPSEKIQLIHQLWSRRMMDKDNGKIPTLWDFAIDITGEGRSNFIWYKILVEYQEAEDDKIHCGDFLFICFDLLNRRLKTEGTQYLKGRFKDLWEL